MNFFEWEIVWYDVRFCNPLPGVICDVIVDDGRRTQGVIPIPAKSDQFYTHGGIIIPLNVLVWRPASEILC